MQGLKHTAIAACALSVLMGVTVLDAQVPAEAGSVTIKITPKGKDARALSTGLRLYSLLSNIKNRASVSQNGDNNASAISQGGRGNVVGVIQSGSGHSSTVTQSGNGNGLAVIQLGKNTNSNVTQTGGQLGIILQGGW